MITTTISRIDKTGDNSISVCVQFDGGTEPTQKFYAFDINEQITLDIIKERVKPDLEKMNSVESKITELQSLVGQTI